MSYDIYKNILKIWKVMKVFMRFEIATRESFLVIRTLCVNIKIPVGVFFIDDADVKAILKHRSWNFDLNMEHIKNLQWISCPGELLLLHFNIFLRPFIYDGSFNFYDLNLDQQLFK